MMRSRHPRGAVRATLALLAWLTWPGPVAASLERAAPADVGIDPAMLATLETRAERGDFGKLKSLLIVRHGKLAYEKYFAGHGPDELMPLYSVTKSWGATLIGMALREGLLEGVDAPLHELFPSYADVFAGDAARRAITLRDILTMRHGFAWDEWSTWFTNPQNPVWQMTRSADWWRYVLGRPVTAPPDSVFRYSTGTSNLMGGVIHEATGQSALEFAADRLFPSLGITEHHVEVDLSGQPRGGGIDDFPEGFTPTGHGLWLRAEDMAKLGQLWLQGGVWEGRRLLDSTFVDEAWGRYTTAETDPEALGPGVSYGYQWWGYDLETPEGTVRAHAANGWGGQFIFVVPRYDLVVVSTADNGNPDGSPTMITGLRDVILPGLAPSFDAASDAGLTGSWYAPALPGQGFMLEVVPATGQVIIYWMTFTPDASGQLWLGAVGQLHGRRATLEFLRPIGGSFAGGDTARLDGWAEVELRFQDCTHATLSFASEVAGVEGELSLVRITPNTTCVESTARE